MERWGKTRDKERQGKIREGQSKLKGGQVKIREGGSKEMRIAMMA